jgi:hypothetical protein
VQRARDAGGGEERNPEAGHGRGLVSGTARRAGYPGKMILIFI